MLLSGFPPEFTPYPDTGRLPESQHNKIPLQGVALSAVERSAVERPGWVGVRMVTGLDSRLLGNDGEEGIYYFGSLLFIA